MPAHIPMERCGIGGYLVRFLHVLAICLLPVKVFQRDVMQTDDLTRRGSLRYPGGVVRKSLKAHPRLRNMLITGTSFDFMQ